MSMRRTHIVQSFPSTESDTSSSFSNQFDKSFILNFENLHQLQGSRISSDRLFKILDASMVAQKMGMKMAMDAINPTTGDNSHRKFINCYLDSTLLLLDACTNIQLRLGRIRNCLDSIPIGLHYLEGELEPSKIILQQAATTLESSHFRDKRNYSKMEKSLSRMITFGKKLNRHKIACQDTTDTISPTLYKALTSSWAMAVLAIKILNSSTSFRSLTNPSVHALKVEPRTILHSEPSKKMKMFQKKLYEIGPMEEFASTYLASQSLLKLISAWQKGGSSSLRRMAVKAVARELRMRKEVLEKTLPLLEDKIEAFYQQIVAMRISMFGLLPKAQKEEVFERVKHSIYEEKQRNNNHTQYQKGVAWDKVKTLVTVQPGTRGRVRPRFFGFIKNTSVNPVSFNV